MSRLTCSLVVALFLVAPEADAGQILYATAATDNTILGYCTTENGGLAPDPRVRRATVNNPRRVIVAPDPNGGPDVLYVAGNTRVEAFTIGPDGKLTSLGRTSSVQNANPRDITVDPERRMLYMPQRRQERLAAYPLAADGTVAEEYTSCVRGNVFNGWEDVEARDGLLYATATTGRGEIDIFRLEADGSLPNPREEEVEIENEDGTTGTTTLRCDDFDTPPDSQRRCMWSAGAFVLSGNMLYVTERFRFRISAFRMQPDGLFSPVVPLGSGGCENLDQQARDSKTNEIVRYVDIIEFGGTVFGSFFDGGRVHSFPLKKDDDGALTILPKRRKSRTNQEFTRTPVRMAAGQAANGKLALYVSGGQNNRVEAYRLKQRKKGLLPKDKPFSRTSELRQTFPNDVVLATVREACN